MRRVVCKKNIIMSVLLATLIFSSLTCCLFNLTKLKTSNDDVEATDLTISTLEDLQAFANDVKNGNNYSGKTVVVDSDIDCGGKTFYPIGIDEENSYDPDEAIVPFAGTFDGGGHTIKNFAIEDAFALYYGGGAGMLSGCGFFAALDKGAIVKNLRLYNYQISSTHDMYTVTTAAYMGSSIGGIAGFLAMDGDGKAYIDNCIIDGCVISYEAEASNGIAIGGIIGGNPHMGATITNCLINRITILGESEFVIENVGGIVGNDPASGDAIVSVSDCVVNANNLSYVTSTPSSVCEFNYFTSQPVVDCHSSPNSTSGLDFSNEAGVDGCVWYYYHEFNDGYPYLTMFMDWTQINFKSNDEYMGTVSKSLILIPTELVQKLSYKPTESLQQIFGQTVQANATFGNAFSKWTVDTDDGYMFIANFTKGYFYFSFNSIGSFNPQSSSFVSGTTIMVNNGDIVELTCSHSAVETTIIIQIGENIVTYHITQTTHTIDSYGSVWYQPEGQGVQSFNLRNLSSYYDLLKIGNTYTVTPTLKLKSYKVFFE